MPQTFRLKSNYGLKIYPEIKIYINKLKYKVMFYHKATFKFINKYRLCS